MVLSPKTGEAVGLHSAGRFLRSNFAVPGAVVEERLQEVLSGRAPASNVSQPVGPHGKVTPAVSGGLGTSSSLSLFRSAVEAGNPYPAGDQRDRVDGSSAAVDTEDEVFTEAVAADYRGRVGYEEDLLGAPIPLPSVTGRQDDVLTFSVDGVTDNVLRYEHFAVTMSKSHRLCLFSTGHID